MSYIGKGLKSVSTANITVDTMIGDGIINTLSISQNGVESVNDVSVYYQGISQIPGTDYTLTGTTVTFTTIPTNNMKVVVVTKADSIKDRVNDNSVTGASFADNSITNSKIIGLDASKLTGVLPAMDGTALTNKSIPTAPLTSSASDPVVDTNGTLGDIWTNTTTGQMFVLTDATTDQNVWTNAGNGDGHITYTPITGYQGSQYGYISGAAAGTKHDNIEKFSFASNGHGVVVGNLTIPRGIMGGCSSTTYGHSVGGNNDGQGGGSTSVIDRFSFASDGDATNWSNLSSTNSYCMTWTEWDVSGYTMGGDTDMIEKFSFASSSTGVDTGANVYNGWINSSATHTDRVNGYGYGSGGQGGSDIIHRYQFNTSNNSVNVGNLQVSQRSYHNGCNSATHGFTVGGYGTTYSKPGKCEKFAFASGTQAVLWGVMGDVNDAGGQNCCPSGADHGYIIGGQNHNTWVNLTRAWKFSFASLSAHIHIGDLSGGEPSAYGASNQY